MMIHLHCLFFERWSQWNIGPLLLNYLWDLLWRGQPSVTTYNIDKTLKIISKLDWHQSRPRPGLRLAFLRTCHVRSRECNLKSLVGNSMGKELKQKLCFSPSTSLSDAWDYFMTIFLAIFYLYPILATFLAYVQSALRIFRLFVSFEFLSWGVSAAPIWGSPAID